MSFPRYERYKDSGVEWLGEVPEHWRVIPLKRLADFINGDAFKPTEWAESGVPIIRIQNLNGGEEFNYYEGEVEPRYLVHDGDLLFGWSGNRGTSFGPFLWRRKEVCALNQHIFRVVPATLPKQALYWTLKAVTAHVEDQAHGIIGMVHITKGDLGAINVPIPPSEEHGKLARFLDQETAKIDALIEEQRRLIDLLKEKRQAVISHAVTKGLNSDSKMTSTGNEWLHSIPGHWATGQLIRVAKRIVVGIAEAATHAYADIGVPILRSTNIRPNRIIGDILYVDPMFAGDRESKLIRSGDLVTVRTGNAGVTAVIPEELDGCQCFTMLITTLAKGMNPQFFCHYLNSHGAVSYFGIEGWGTAQVNISVPILKALPVPIPPQKEQDAIVTFLEAELARFDNLIGNAASAAALLKERRSAIISAAVTGKIDVRNYTPKEAA
jgi:type I restriction enzyme S subunit